VLAHVRLPRREKSNGNLFFDSGRRSGLSEINFLAEESNQSVPVAAFASA
jgi:hypothetical protein